MTPNTADALLERSVRDELAANPQVDADDIVVAVIDGFILMLGTVPSFAQKSAAARIVKRIAGFRGTRDELSVILSSSRVRGDRAIAAAAVHALAWETTLPVGSVTVRVEHGHLTLEGNVDWPYQVCNAERAVAHLLGVRSVLNSVRVV